MMDRSDAAYSEATIVGVICPDEARELVPERRAGVPVSGCKLLRDERTDRPVDDPALFPT
jgi:hypothetical protein